MLLFNSILFNYRNTYSVTRTYAIRSNPMKRTLPLLLTALTLFIAMLACGSAAPTAQPALADTPDVQGTVDASIAATNVAATAVQATIDASVQATVQAQITPRPSDVSQLSEEEVVSEVDTAVQNAADASTRAAEASTDAASDGQITIEEVDAIYADYTAAQDDLQAAYDLIYAYYDVYGELAEDTLALLQDLENDLDDLDSSLDEISNILNEIQVSLAAGVELADETLTQLETTAQTIQAKADTVQTQTQTWLTEFQANLEARGTAVLEVLPDNIPADRNATIESLFTYLDLVKTSLADNKISSLELADIAQARANSVAGIEANGGLPLQALAGQMDQLTVQIAKGQLPAARSGLGGFEASLPKRP